MSRNEQIVRQWSLLRRFEASPQGLAFADVSELYRTERTFYRDRDALEAAGFPLYPFDNEGRRCWRLAETFRRQAGVPVTFSETLALHWASRTAESLQGGVFGDALRSLVAKLDSGLTPEMRAFARQLDEVVVAGRFQHPVTAELRALVEALTRACRERRSVDIIYTSQKGEQSCRRVDPYHLWARESGLYLFAWCHRRQAVRTFLVSRIEEATATEVAFTPRPEVRIDEYIHEHFRIMDEGQPEEVRIYFAPEAALYVEGRIWHPTQTLEPQTDGGVVLCMRVDGLSEVASWVLSFGPRSRVLAPPRLVEIVVRQLEATLRGYPAPAG